MKAALPGDGFIAEFHAIVEADIHNRPEIPPVCSTWSTRCFLQLNRPFFYLCQKFPSSGSRTVQNTKDVWRVNKTRPRTSHP